MTFTCVQSFIRPELQNYMTWPSPVRLIWVFLLLKDRTTLVKLQWRRPLQALPVQAFQAQQPPLPHPRWLVIKISRVRVHRLQAQPLNSRRLWCLWICRMPNRYNRQQLYNRRHSIWRWVPAIMVTIYCWAPLHSSANDAAQHLSHTKHKYSTNSCAVCSVLQIIAPRISINSRLLINREVNRLRLMNNSALQRRLSRPHRPSTKLQDLRVMLRFAEVNPRSISTYSRPGVLKSLCNLMKAIKKELRKKSIKQKSKKRLISFQIPVKQKTIPVLFWTPILRIKLKRKNRNPRKTIWRIICRKLIDRNVINAVKSSLPFGF